MQHSPSQLSSSQPCFPPQRWVWTKCRLHIYYAMYAGLFVPRKCGIFHYFRLSTAYLESALWLLFIPILMQVFL